MSLMRRQIITIVLSAVAASSFTVLWMNLSKMLDVGGVSNIPSVTRTIVTVANGSTNNATADSGTANSTTTATTRFHPAYENMTQDEKCLRMFEWPMIDHLSSGLDAASDPIDFDNLPQSRHLTAPRMTGKKLIQMTIEVKRGNATSDLLTVVDMSTYVGGMSQPHNENLWHRMISQYGSWASLQVARLRYRLRSADDRTFFYFPCDVHAALPPEWIKLGNASCDSSLLRRADVLVSPFSDGLLWDLAWDMDFRCPHSEMFRTFASLFSERSLPRNPVGCFVGRQGRGLREVANFREVLAMMNEIFPRVRELKLTSSTTNEETLDVLYECRVLFGVHGAGFMNSVFARPGVAVVEMIGKSEAAYFRNVNMLLGQYYESIRGDATKDLKDEYWTVDLGEAREALWRARNYADEWFRENGYWR
mmetsp:Transcript_8562/g.17256  ORF Transcript_8562/g.17256 Transcript_8562/m.17256 type:complete len:421 (-) Transcript_8562:213-1475(-)